MTRCSSERGEEEEIESGNRVLHNALAARLVLLVSMCGDAHLSSGGLFAHLNPTLKNNNCFL